MSALFLAPSITHAQTYDKAHKLSVSEFKGAYLPTIKKGEKYKAAVMEVQYLLQNRGFYKAKVDGVFGSATEAAVRNFQRAKGLKADGIVGPQTWPYLLVRLKKGDRGDAVRALQIALIAIANLDSEEPLNFEGVDGIFGAVTQSNVREFQKSQGPQSLKSDGIVGARTWSALFP